MHSALTYEALGMYGRCATATSRPADGDSRMFSHAMVGTVHDSQGGEPHRARIASD